MLPVWILLGCVVLSIIAACVLWLLDFEDAAGGFGILTIALVLATLITWGALLDAQHDRYNEETQQLCDKKHGILSQKDGLCYVNNKPVEFSPGVWKR